MAHIKKFYYSNVISLYTHKLDSSFARELQLQNIMDFPKHPDINLKMYVPLKTYTQDVTFFPGFSSPILLKNQNTQYGFQLKVGDILPYFDIYMQLEGYKSYFMSNIYSPTQQRYIYAGIGVQKELLRPDKHNISWALKSLTSEKVRIGIIQKKNKMLFDFKRLVMNYLLYREKIQYESKILNYLIQIDTIISKEWHRQIIASEKYMNFKLMFLSLSDKFKEDSLNYSIYYERIKAMIDIPDSFVINEDTVTLDDTFYTLLVQPYKRDIQFTTDSLEALVEYYDGLLNCSNAMPGISLNFEIGGKGVMTSEGIEEKLFPSIVNLGVTLNFSSFSGIGCKRLIKERFTNKLSRIRKELFIRNKERIAYIKRYKGEQKRYVRLYKDLENLLSIAQNDSIYFDFGTFRSYITMYDKILSKIYTMQLEMEKIRSEFP